jgi:hypothetical protein
MFKIYKLVSEEDELLYIGATKLNLRQRIACHKSQAKVSPHIPVCEYINNNFIEIKLIEELDNKEAALKREKELTRELQPKLNIKNKNPPNESYSKQYYQNNKEKIKERSKTVDKEKIKKYYQENKEKLKEYNKKYYQAKKEKLQKLLELESSLKTTTVVDNIEASSEISKE